MNTDTAILKQQAKALETEVRKVIEIYLDVWNWVSLFTMLGDLAIRRKDTMVVGVMMYAVEFLNQKGKR
jgi:hypothetical protein